MQRTVKTYLHWLGLYLQLLLAVTKDPKPNGNNDIIRVAPVNTVGCYGGMSTFYCESERSDVILIEWKIIDESITYDITDEVAELRGISITTNGVGNSSLNIIGNETNNGISIQCVIVTLGSPYFDTHTALFTVFDIPPVTNLTITFTNNGTIMNCKWIQPSCLPVKCCYHIFVNDEEKILYDKDQTSFNYPDVLSCVNYNVSVIVGDSEIENYRSLPMIKNLSAIKFQDYEDIVIDLLHSEVMFMDEIERTIDFVYVVQNHTALDIERCSLVFFNTYSESITNETTAEINLLKSYDESTGIGNYTIGPFNESFIGNYSLALMNVSSMEPLELTTIEFSTYHVQEVNITQLFNGRIIIECRFAINSDADGCSVKFYQYSDKQTKTILIPKTSTDTDTATMVTDLPEGEYFVRVYDVVDGVVQSFMPPAKTLVDIKISGTNDDSISNLLPSTSTPATGLVRNTVVSIDVTTTSITTPPTITKTESHGVDLYLIVVVSILAVIILMLVIVLSIVIVIKCHKHITAKYKLTFNSEDTMTQKTNAEHHVYSELPVHHNNSSVLTAVPTQYNTVDEYYEFNTLFSASHTNENRQTAVAVETALSDYDEEGGFLFTPCQSSRSHYENANVLIPQKEMTQVQDSDDSVHSSVNGIKHAIPIQSSDAHLSHVNVPLSSQCSNNDYRQQLNDSQNEDIQSLDLEVAASELHTHSDELHYYSHCSVISNDDHNNHPQQSSAYHVDNDHDDDKDANQFDDIIDSKGCTSALLSIIQHQPQIKLKVCSVMIHAVGIARAGKCTLNSMVTRPPGVGKSNSIRLILKRNLESTAANDIDEMFEILESGDMLLSKDIEKFQRQQHNFVRLFDSGGQPEYFNLLQSLHHSNPSMLNILVLKLDDDLYETLTAPHQLSICQLWTNHDGLKFIIKMCQLVSNQYLTAKNVVPHVMIIGTHCDTMCHAKIRKINKALRSSIKKRFGHMLLCKSENEVIFPINTMAGEGAEKCAVLIQECISTALKECVIPVEVPLNWLIYQTAIIKEKRAVMKISDCYQIGESLGMDSDDVENALKFLTEVSAILYSPNDLPGYVITKVEPLMKKISALFDATMSNQTEESHSTTGIFRKAYLSQIFKTFEQNELSEEEFFKILESFKIVSRVGDEEYFIPSALSPKPDKAAHTPFDHHCRPLIIKYENFISHGFYNIMVINLLSSEVNDDYQFEVCNDVIQWRNEIRIREVTGKISGIIKLTDKDDWIEISTTTANTKEDCPKIYKAVNKAIAQTQTLRRFKYAGLDQPTVTTLCPLCTEEDHLSILSMADNTVTCSIDSSKTGHVTEDISCWFEEQEVILDSVQPNFSVPSNFSPIIVGSRPFLQSSSYQRSTSSSSEADSNDNLLGHHDKPAIDLQLENKTESSNNSNEDSRALSLLKNFKAKIMLDIKSFNSMEGSYLFTFEYPISDTVVLDSNEIRSTMLLSAQTSTKHLNDELYSALEKNATMMKLKENDQKMSELERKRSPCLYKVVKIQTPWKFLTEVILEQQSSLVVSNSVQLSAVLSLPQVVSYTLESQILGLIECPHKSIQSSMISTETALPIQSKDLLIECDVHCGPQVSRVHVVPLSTQHSSNNDDDDYLQHSNDSYDENNNSIQSSMNNMEEATILHTDTQSADSELHVIMRYFRRYISTDYQLLSIDNTFLDNILHSIGTDQSKKEGFPNVPDYSKAIKEKQETQECQSILHAFEAMTKVEGDISQCNIVFHGPPGAGKSSIKALILGKPPRPKGYKQTVTDIVGRSNPEDHSSSFFNSNSTVSSHKETLRESTSFNAESNGAIMSPFESLSNDNGLDNEHDHHLSDHSNSYHIHNCHDEDSPTNHEDEIAKINEFNDIGSSQLQAGLDATMLNQTEESEKPCHSITGTIQEAKCLRNKFKQLITELNEKLTWKSMIDLNVNARVRDYFIPSALSPEPDETKTKLEMYCRPLVIKCGSSFQQSIFYHMMANDLLSSTVNDEFEFKLCNDVNQWRNEIQIREVTGKISGIIKLTNKDDWIEISTTTANTKKDCPNIYEAMNKAVTRTLRRFKYAGLDQPTVTTLCPLCPSTEEDHLSILSMADNTVTCSIDSSKTGHVTEDISCWFEEQETIPNYSVRPNIIPPAKQVVKSSNAGVVEEFIPEFTCPVDDTLDDMKIKKVLIVQKLQEEMEKIQMRNRDKLEQMLQKYRSQNTKKLKSHLLDLRDKYFFKKENTADPWPTTLGPTKHIKPKFDDLGFSTLNPIKRERKRLHCYYHDEQKRANLRSTVGLSVRNFMQKLMENFAILKIELEEAKRKQMEGSNRTLKNYGWFHDDIECIQRSMKNWINNSHEKLNRKGPIDHAYITVSKDFFSFGHFCNNSETEEGSVAMVQQLAEKKFSAFDKELDLSMIMIISFRV